MKILIIIILLILTGCDELEELDDIVEDYCSEHECIKKTTSEIYPQYNYRTDYNGIYTEYSYDSWAYKSHMVPHDYEDIPGVYCHFCRKVQTHYIDDKAFTAGREVTYSFDFTVDKWNYEDPPFSVIVFQQWAERTETENVSHPIVTLKLKKWQGLSLGLFEQSWQFNNHSANPYDINDPDDKKHRHPDSKNHGYLPLNVGQTYKIELTLIDGVNIEVGGTLLKIDGRVIARSRHRVRSLNKPNTIAWGLYWQGGHKNGYNGGLPNKCSKITGEDDLVCKSIQTSVNNFRVFETISIK